MLLTTIYFSLKYKVFLVFYDNVPGLPHPSPPLGFEVRKHLSPVPLTEAPVLNVAQLSKTRQLQQSED